MPNTAPHHASVSVPSAVGCGQGGGALLQVVGPPSALTHAADGDGVDAVGVAVAGAMVAPSAPVPRRPHKDGSLSLSALELVLAKAGDTGEGISMLMLFTH